jgi:putative transcriptional regulator
MAERLINHLRAERAKRGLTQAELAALVGVSRKTINTVENEVFVPSTVLALRLARALAMPVESLFHIEE